MANKILKFAVRAFSACAITSLSALAADDSSLDTVVVTGSRIGRDAAFESPVPMVTVGRKEVQESGFNILGDVLTNMPQALVNTNLQSSGTLFNAGQSRVDMRGLGSNRTLVLLDGRRLITGDFRSPAVDLNMIPSSMVERVEMISGGASAVYGSEAIAGVVNIITRKNLDGFVMDVQGGVSSEIDGEELKASLSYGAPFAADRGHFLIGAEYATFEAIYQTDRDWAYPGIRRNNSVSPQTIVPASRTNLMPTATFQLGTNNSVSIAQDRSVLNSNSAACRTATVSALCQDPWLFYTSTYNVLQSPMERRSVRSYAEFDFLENLKLFGEAMYSAVDSLGITTPAFSNPSTAMQTLPVTMRGDNAYLAGSSTLATQLRNSWTAAGLPLNDTRSVPVGKFWEEFGTRNTEILREIFRVQAGVSGGFQLLSRDFNWETYAQYSELDGKVLAHGVPNKTRVQQAVNAIAGPGGTIVCSDAAAQAAGCVPWNLIDGPSSAAVAWANGTARFDGLAIQKVVAANLSGSILRLPGGDLGMASGFEYRDESSDYVQDALSASGALAFNAIGRTRGEYHVSEAYLELVAPLFSNLPFVHLLSVEAAGRMADYSTTGGVDQWRLQATWAPVSDVSFRASVATAVRAPNITELYGPRSENFATGALDPCDRAQITAVASDPARQALRIANCNAVISNASFTYNPATFESNIGPGRPSLRTYGGGYDGLSEETARTSTFGVVLKPRWLDRFSISVDYWNIEIDDAISTIPINTLLANFCYDVPQAPTDNRYCGYIQRLSSGAPADVGDIISVTQSSQNVQSIETSGVDLAIRYVQSLGGAGDLSVGLDATKVIRWDLFAFPGAPVTHFVGAISTSRAIPEYKAQAMLGWTRDRFSAQWQTRFIDSFAVSEVDPPASRVPFYTGNYFEHDLRGSFRWTEDFATNFGAINVTNEHPPSVPEVGNATDSSNSATYDNRGRWFYVGFKYSFGGVQ